MSDTENEICINLSEIDSIFYDDNQLFQNLAYEKLWKYFEDSLVSFDKIKSHSNKIDKIKNCMACRSILIHGQRGCGKTVFLENIEQQLQKNRLDLFKKYYFFESIDPTLLNSEREINTCESFLAVIIAKIHEQMQESILSNHEDSEMGYYQKFREIADGLSSLRLIKNEEDGIDQIYANQNSLKFEQNLHEYFKLIYELLGGKILVLRFDDVDMSFSRCYKILEAIRKYLSSPYLLTIICGDTELYRRILFNNFYKDLYNSSYSYNKKDTDENIYSLEADKLSERYLIKVMPFDRQIKLQTLEDILKNNKITFKTESNTYTYEDIRDMENKYLNYNNKRHEYQNKLLKFESPRLFLQYKKAMQDWYEMGDNTYDEKYLKFRDFHKISEDFFGNLKSFSELHEWLKYNCFACQGDYFDHDILLKKFNEDFLYDSDFISHEGDNSSSLIYYPITNINKQSKKEEALKKIKNCDPKVQFIFNLFVFNNYYCPQADTYWLVYAGRFIEFILATLPCKYRRMENAKFRQSFWRNLNILNQIPLFSSIKNNKEFIKFDSVDKEDSNLIGNLDISFENDSSKIFSNIFRYLNQYIHPDEWDEGQNYWFEAHFMREVLNHFFSNLNIFRNENFNPSEESLLDYATRVVYMFLNAIGACELENDAKISFKNICLKSPFKYQDFIENDNSFSRNIKPFIEDKEHFSLTKFIYNHPVIQMIIELNKLQDSPSHEDRFGTTWKDLDLLTAKLKTIPLPGFIPKNNGGTAVSSIEKRKLDTLRRKFYKENMSPDMLLYLVKNSEEDTRVKLFSDFKRHSNTKWYQNVMKAFSAFIEKDKREFLSLTNLKESDMN